VATTRSCDFRERVYKEESAAVSGGGLHQPTPSILRVARHSPEAS
jgi:hypothetical protein